MAKLLKSIVHGISLALVFLPAAATGFGRIKPLYTLFAQSYSIVPGILGDYLRIAFYRLVLEQCSLSSRVSFGTFFAHPDTTVGPNVYIGSYCILGKVSIGARTQIASGVQILSGRHQHARGSGGEITGSDKGHFTRVNIGADCWIGAAAIVMADVGAGSTVGAGSIVTREIPPGSVAVGNPARVIQSKEAAAGGSE